MFYNQGISIVLNKFFPPIRYKSVNASYSVGGALAGYTKTLSNALMNAFLPEIVSLEGEVIDLEFYHRFLEQVV